MRPIQKILMSALWVLMVLIMVSVIGAGLWRRGSAGGILAAAAGGNDDDNDSVIASVPDFSLVDQDNRPVTLASLAGKPWIADLIFTHCAGPCPIMTAQMASLQKPLAGSDLRFVSISVDPKQDTPAVLKQYAKKFAADESRWLFLTGDEQAIYTTARGLLLPADPAKGDEPIIHSTKFVLVDATGKIRKYYSSANTDDMAALKRDAASLASNH
jgi:cytochrome oxidase Cu insertion factor (SCO1/SenC/PrrC family)